MTIQEELARVQKILKSPKSQYNKFGNFYFRSCEDILESVKEVTNCAIMIQDEIILIGSRFYVKATAQMIDGEGAAVSSCAFAREAETKKGMDEAMITGSASSYARKYALNGLFAIDDTRDSDTKKVEESPKDEPAKTAKKDVEKGWYNDFNKHKAIMEDEIKSGKKTVDQIINKLKQNYKISTGVVEQIKLLGI